jgi:uncharacterized protein YegP (UPF0339 family)
MHIEVWKSVAERDQKWYWHFKNKGRVTADSEAFPTRAHAARAAQSVVKAVIKRVSGVPPCFTFMLPVLGVTKITWL